MPVINIRLPHLNDPVLKSFDQVTEHFSRAIHEDEIVECCGESIERSFFLNFCDLEKKMSPTGTSPTSKNAPNLKGKDDKSSSQAQRKRDMKKTVKLSDQDFLTDWYEVLKLANEDGSSEDEIRQAYRRRCLETHPDKQVDKNDEEFKKVQRAFEILGNADSRTQYDSSRGFDDTIPVEVVKEEEFYKQFQPVFERNKKWSCSATSGETNAHLVPSLGDDSTNMTEVKQFYDFWFAFKSWRDFSHEVELEEIDEDMLREEKRFYQRENVRRLDKLRRMESKRIRMLVDRAYENDPRLKRAKREAELEKEREKQEREDRKRKKLEEEMQKKREQAAKEKAEAEEKKRKEEEEKAMRVENQEKMIVLFESRELLDVVASNKLLPHKVRIPNVEWLCSKCASAALMAEYLQKLEDFISENKEDAVKPKDISPPKKQAQGDSIIGSPETKNPPSQSSQTPQNKSNSRKKNSSSSPILQDPPTPDVEIPLVLFFNAMIENKEKEVGRDRYGEPIRKTTSATTTDAAESKSGAAKKARPPTEWTDDDLLLLQKAIGQYPGGTVDRWRKIGTNVLRDKFTEEEVLSKTKEMEVLWHQDRSMMKQKMPSLGDKDKGVPQDEITSSSPASVVEGGSVESVEDWTVRQQKQLEDGLRELKAYKEKDKYVKVAAFVDGKNAKQCFERFKYLCSLNKKR